MIETILLRKEDSQIEPQFRQPYQERLTEPSTKICQFRFIKTATPGISSDRFYVRLAICVMNFFLEGHAFRLEVSLAGRGTNSHIDQSLVENVNINQFLSKYAS
jgi:hypothetical protein